MKKRGLKTFKDLVFEDRANGRYQRAKMHFANGYGANVIKLADGLLTIGVLHDGGFDHEMNEKMREKLWCRKTEKDITKTMIRIQELESKK